MHWVGGLDILFSNLLFLHVQDCLEGIDIGVSRGEDLVNILNLGTDMVCSVNESIDIICRHIGCTPKLNYSGGRRGWVGDSPLIHPNTARVNALAVFRFVSILGPRYSHGHVFDFYNQLRSHPEFLNILGDGNQRKSYLHVQDCLEGIDIGAVS